jgi:hypothetical protein
LYPSGLRGLSAKELFVGSNPTKTSKKTCVIQIYFVSLYQIKKTMFKVNENSENQARVVWEQITREWDCVTEDGTEFQVRIVEDGNGVEFWTNLSNDGEVDSWYQPEYDSELYIFIGEILEEGW